MGIQIETAFCNGFEMRFFRFGSGDKKLVILPGLSVQSVMPSADAIAAQYAAMAQDFTVFVFDRREALPEKYGIADMARDTAKAINAIGLEGIYLFGASQGGMIAMQLALEHTQLVKKLVLGSTAAKISDGDFAALEKWIKLAEKKDGAALYLAFGKAVYPDAVFEQYRETLGAMGESVTDAEFERFITLAKGTRGFDLLERLSEIKCPVLLIGDKTDAVLGEGATAEIAERLKNSPDFRLHIYDGYGHAAYDTAPDYVGRMLDFFIE